jgi:hypothetical protein
MTYTLGKRLALTAAFALASAGSYAAGYALHDDGLCWTQRCAEKQEARNGGAFLLLMASSAGVIATAVSGGLCLRDAVRKIRGVRP